MQTKYDIGKTALVQVHIESINILSDGTIQYYAEVPSITPKKHIFNESVLEDGDFVPVKEYEHDINRLKDEVNSLRGYYRVNVNGMDDKRFDAGAEETAGTGIQKDGGTV